jgi:acyl-phosphate glycerol 3-phosphate acyltransferase
VTASMRAQRATGRRVQASCRGVSRSCALLACAAAYLYGSLPLVYWLGRRSGVNLRKSGSGNVGVSNLLSTGGRKWVVPAALFDASKGYLPIQLCRRLGYPPAVAELAGICGVVGQCWPLFLRFNGGRGQSAFLGAALLINRRGGLLALSIVASGVLWHLERLWSHASYGHLPAAHRLGSTRSRAVPLSCLLGTVAFALVCLGERDRRGQRRWIPVLLTTLLLLRRLTAPLPDDAQNGPARRPIALLYRLLYDRNTLD